MEGKHKIAPAPVMNINNHDIENDQENNSNISGKYHIKNLDTGNVMDIREYAQLGQEENERLAHIPPPTINIEQQEQSNSNETTGQKVILFGFFGFIFITILILILNYSFENHYCGLVRK